VAFWRLLGGKCVEFCIHPIIASTPADFWRRYNRWIGQFVNECIFKRFGGLKKTFIAVMISFLSMGILHEYIVTVVSETFKGYMLLFFMINGMAVAMTFRKKPKGLMRLLSCALTIIFLSLSSILVFLATKQMGLLH
jgi:D-alanyl-lipoteichoic acid acyltransferase DltB (MBOAT superfamily)